jgi:hypothetical protein
VQGRGNYFEDIPRSEAFTLQAVNHLGGMSNVMFCICNEADARNVPLKKAKEWYVAIFKALKAGGITPERIDVGALLNVGLWNGEEWVRELTLQDHTKACAKEVYGEQPGKRVWLPVHNVTSGATKQFPYGPLWQQAMDYFKHLPCRLSNDGCKDKDATINLLRWRDMCAATVGTTASKWRIVNVLRRAKARIMAAIGTERKIVFEYLSDADLNGKVLAARYMADGIGRGNLPNYHRKEYRPEVTPAPDQPVTPPVVPPVDDGEKWRVWLGIGSLVIVAALVIVALLTK